MSRVPGKRHGQILQSKMQVYIKERTNELHVLFLHELKVVEKVPTWCFAFVMLVSDRQCRIRGPSTKIPETVTRNGALLKIHRFCDTCVLFFNIQYHTLCQYNLAEDLTCCILVIKTRSVKCPKNSQKSVY